MNPVSYSSLIPHPSSLILLPSSLQRPQYLLRIDGRLPDGVDAVEQIIELSGQLGGRLHGHDLVGDELEGVLDQIELRAGHAEVVADLAKLLRSLEDDLVVLLGHVALGLRDLLR